MTFSPAGENHPQQLVIVGAGGFGREAADVVVAINESEDRPVWNLVGIYDDSPSPQSLARLTGRNVAYLGELPPAADDAEIHYVIGVGDPQVRRLIDEQCQNLGWKPAVLVHPESRLGTVGDIGPGSVVCAGAQISTNVKLGRHVHVNPNATIGHDSVLGDYVSVNPAAVISGEVRVSENSLIGANATILQGLYIGARALVGAAACVVRDVPDAVIVKGVPAVISQVANEY